MVGAEGFEPSTNGLKVRCSTTELHPQCARVFLSGSVSPYVTEDCIMSIDIMIMTT